MTAAEKYAAFGAWAFEMFWQDGEPSDIDVSDAQEKAVELGLIGRTAEYDAEATHSEGCDWQPRMPVDECSCFVPLVAPRKKAAL